MLINRNINTACIFYLSNRMDGNGILKIYGSLIRLPTVVETLSPKRLSKLIRFKIFASSLD